VSTAEAVQKCDAMLCHAMPQTWRRARGVYLTCLRAGTVRRGAGWCVFVTGMLDTWLDPYAADCPANWVATGSVVCRQALEKVCYDGFVALSGAGVWLLVWMYRGVGM
jgi:hypothetical protein